MDHVSHLASACLAQHRAFGLFADTEPDSELAALFRSSGLGADTERELARFLDRHGRPAALALAGACPAEPPAGVPFLMTARTGAEDAVVAGYVAQAPAIPVGRLLEERHRLWALQVPAPDPGLYPVVMRGALFMLSGHGFDAALRYLLDLVKHGCLAGRSTVLQCMLDLCRGRQRVAADARLPALWLGERTLDAGDWSEAALRTVDPAALPVLRTAGATAEFLAGAIEHDIAEVRAAGSFDDWMLGTFWLARATEIVRRVLDGLDLLSDPGLVAVGLRIEEISADSSASIVAWRIDARAFPFAPDFAYARGIAAAVRHAVDDWAHRILDERVLVPDQLIDLLLPEGCDAVADVPDDALPPAWRLLSGAVAAVHAEKLSRAPEYRQLRRTSMPDDVRKRLRRAGEGGMTPMQAEAGAIAAQVSRADPAGPAALAILARITGLYPYADDWRHVEAQALFQAGQPDAAWHALVDAILIDPSRARSWALAAKILAGAGDEEGAARLTGFAASLGAGAAPGQGAR